MASGVDLTDKLSKLRGMMTLHQPSVDYYIISNQDAHGSPLVGESEKRLQWISGFSSLRGVAVVSQQAAHIFVEASDLAQAEAELSLEDWFVIPIEASIGLDARHVWHDQAVFLKSLAVVNKSKLVPVYQNLVDVIWEDKPQRGEEVVSVHPIEVPDNGSGPNQLHFP
ncbi:hypothetical protein JAAARDRAFT_506154 [Jaapia argillacea MUCL 33604]|uniref:Uncharacterized protein n=1 Tax=Jaapia argillacea MUCL 33604 TaxID=933084 RepID=A0A067PMQ5_9AGAM|nr:hypothetical protein JAAARDRAFT_506154 [Jaapia argillacea MUCL 33604]